MSFAYIQSATSLTATVAFSSNVTAGSLLILAVGNRAQGSISDTQGNTWKKLTATANSSYYVEVWYVASANAGATTVTLGTGTGTDNATNVAEYSVPAGTMTVIPFQVNGSSGVSFSFNFPSTTPMLLNIGVYDFHTSHTWTGSNITVRQNALIPDGAALGMGDAVLSTILGTTTYSMTGGSGTPVAVASLFMIVPSGSSGGLVVNRGMDGGCNG